MNRGGFLGVMLGIFIVIERPECRKVLSFLFCSLPQLPFRSAEARRMESGPAIYCAAPNLQGSLEGCSLSHPHTHS